MDTQKLSHEACNKVHVLKVAREHLSINCSHQKLCVYLVKRSCNAVSEIIFLVEIDMKMAFSEDKKEVLILVSISY